MAIFDRTNAWTPNTAFSKLDHFADRHEHALDFLSKLNAIEPTPPQISYLYAMGGSGKSLLLRYLYARCCYRLDPAEWELAQKGPPATLVERVGASQKPVHVPSALLDFGARPIGQKRPLEVLPALFMIKGQLAKFGISTPRFDFAALNYLQKSGLDYKKTLPELFPASELDLVVNVVDALAALPFVGTGRALLALFEKRTNNVLAQWRMERPVEDAYVEMIVDSPADPDLADLLPYFFAKDLNKAVTETGGIRRIALLFDTHEAFWGEDLYPTPSSISLSSISRDKWLRLLLGRLDLERGIVVVVAGRKPPRWALAEDAAIGDDDVDARSVGGLSPVDANWYLDQMTITDPKLKGQVIAYSTGEPGEVHPFMLGLYTDILASPRGAVEGARLTTGIESSLEDRGRLLVARLMSSVAEGMQRNVIAVAATRSFGFGEFEYLANRLRLNNSYDDFTRLVNFSFILEKRAGPDNGPGEDRAVYAVHQLLRRELARSFPKQTREANVALHKYYVELTGPAAQAEAALHLMRVDRVAGVAFWCAAVDELLDAGRYRDCVPFVGIVMDVSDPNSNLDIQLFFRVGRVYLGIGAVEDAKNLLAQLPEESAESMLLKADIEFFACDYRAAEATARRGIELVPDDERERLYLRLAEILLYTGHFADAKAVLAGPGFQPPHNPSWYMMLGEVEYFAGDPDRAGELFRSCEDELAVAPAEDVNLTTVGWNQAGLGLIRLWHSDWDAAYSHFEASLAVREKAGHARGIANCYWLMGWARCGARQHFQGRELLARAKQMAVDQGDDVTLAKVRHTEAMSWSDEGDLKKARTLLERVLLDAGTTDAPYDEAHRRLDLAVLSKNAKDFRSMAQHVTAARRYLEGRTFGLLERSYGLAGSAPMSRMAAAVKAFAVGDAVGAPFEGLGPSAILITPDDPIGRRETWPIGSTSDDTDQLLAVARVVAFTPESGNPALGLLENLAELMSAMRGRGPTTMAAVERFVATGELVATSGSTNGAVVRAIPIGWGVPLEAEDYRRDLTNRLTRTTHGAANALVCAQLMAAMAAWSLEGVDGATLVDVASAELRASASAYGLAAADVQTLYSAMDGTWIEPPDGIPLDATETTAAAISVVRTSTGVLESMLRALRLGGDTDTVTAIVGGLLGAVFPAEVDALPWLSDVVLPDDSATTRLVDALASRRKGSHA